MELARKLNNTDYVSRPAALYISDPEVSIPHNKTATFDRDSENTELPSLISQKPMIMIWNFARLYKYGE